MKIKQLIWRNGRAETPFGAYRISWFKSLGEIIWSLRFSSGPSGHYSTEEDARAAAQADFERRARECFEGNDDGKN